jgi:hypothetical protein
LFNSYVFGPNNSASDPVRLYQRGDFLIHFAGVYDIWNIHRMMKYVKLQAEKSENLDAGLLDDWRKSPSINK